MKKIVKQKRKKEKMIFVAVFSIVILIGYFVLIFAHPTFILYSDANTSTHVGAVSDIHIETHSTGYKTRQTTFVYIEFENKDIFYIPLLTLKKNGWDYEVLKETILNQTVEIKTAEAKVDKIVSIRGEEQEIFTYADMNKTQQSNRIGLALIGLIAISFIALYKLL
jgi:hypothetical protein